jgi:GMP synthase-like glutamine amidotransferase
MPSPPLRIAILECDTPLPGTNSQYGGYGGVFTSLLHKATSRLSPPLSPSDLVLSIYDVVTAQEYPKLEDIDAVLLTGSKHNSFDNDPWIIKLVDFCKVVLEQNRVRIIGICFGHQILGRALGSEVGRSDKGWEISVTPIELTAKGQELFGQDTLVCFDSAAENLEGWVLTRYSHYIKCTEI